MITIYTKTHCPNCVKLKTKMDSQGIEYQTVNIEEDLQLREWLVNQGHKSVPQVYEGDVYVGSTIIEVEFHKARKNDN